MTAPRKGTRFRTLVDIRTTALVHPSGPATFAFDCLISRGTILVVYSDPAAITGALACSLEDAALEEKLLRGAEYQAPYPRLSFLFTRRDVGRRLEAIDEASIR